jgi:hypothetical protein
MNARMRVRYERRLSNGDVRRAQKAALLRVRRANYAPRTRLQKNPHRAIRAIFKRPNLNNNAVTRERIRKMRSSNFVSKFLRSQTFGFFFAATIIVCLSLDSCFCRYSVFGGARRGGGGQGLLSCLMESAFKFNKTRLLIGFP